MTAPFGEPLAALVASSVAQFTVRCADGRIAGDADPGEVYRAVEDADRDCRIYDGACVCGGPHEVLVRHVTTTTTAWAASVASDTAHGYALAVGVTVTHTVAERAASVACRDCGGRPTSTCDRCGADVPYSENAGALAWLLRRRQREQWNTCPTAPWITRQTPTPDAWDLALWLDRAGARV